MLFKLVLFITVFFIVYSVSSYLNLLKKRKSLSQSAQSAPDGFVSEISDDAYFSFAYPDTWKIVKPLSKNIYREVSEEKIAPGLGSTRSFNLSNQRITPQIDLIQLFNSLVNGVLSAIKGAKLQFREDFKTETAAGICYRLDYKSMGINFSCYQVALTSSAKKSLILLTFTTQKPDFAKSRELFDKIASSVKFLEQ